MADKERGADKGPNRLVAVTLDEASIARGNPDQEHERAIALYDILEGNSFSVPGRDGPYSLVLGLVGLLLVVWHKLGAGEVTAWNLALALAALLCITAGTLYQKRHVQPCDVRTANAIQLCAALVVTLPFVPFETGAIDPHPHLLGAMAWSVVGLTVGGSSLLYLLIQRGAATQVTSLMYLVPPCTALMAWALFGERFPPLAALGMVIAACGVALVIRK